MQQHARAKRAYPDAIVFFRLGDFYEMFGADAVLVARLLDLTLTSRNRGKPDEVPMAGVPHHAAHGYIAKLLELGHQVAICEQMADPSKVKGIVPREVVRVITPGLITDGSQLDAATNNWLAALEVGAAGVGIALLDLSTGELLAAELPDLAALLAELTRAAPRELVLGFASSDEDARNAARAAIAQALPRAALRDGGELLDANAVLGDLASDMLAPNARRAAARALGFAQACTPGAELPVRRIGLWDPQAALVIDPVAQRHLELVDSWSGLKSATLLSVVDATETAAGARLLRRRLLAPLIDVERIRRRHDAVELFVVHARLRADVKKALASVTDLERLAVRASLGEATPRDLGALRDGLGAALATVRLLDAVGDPALRETLGIASELPDTVDDVRELLERALVERPPTQAKDGAIFLKGFDAALDELSELQQSGAERMVALESRLREETAIPTLKVRYTRVFGWYVEVSRSHAGKAPETWRRKQTVAAGERYTLGELDELAERITSAEERHRERELSLLAELVGTAGRARQRIADIAGRLARWDVAQGLADVAHRHDYARPMVDGSERLEIRDGRHPVVERLAAAGRFVPNDVSLDVDGVRLWLVTGPNMAGKSTLLRQTALTCILAQMGSFVPAKSAHVGIVDRVLSRVGASDDVARGESTFMVEMRETAEILGSATRRSLVILDEIGRGTSTFDGLSIAWAVAEHLDEAVGCRALFATHYHELTQLSDGSAHVENFSVSAREVGDDVVFLHQLVPGAASRSYGIAVAKLAGVPESVLARARAVLATLETTGGVGKPSGGRTDQLDLFAARPAQDEAGAEVLETLRQVEVDRLTPLDALTLIAKLKQRL
jgi:DNA mismatch repair protein MutS